MPRYLSTQNLKTDKKLDKKQKSFKNAGLQGWKIAFIVVAGMFLGLATLFYVMAMLQESRSASSSVFNDNSQGYTIQTITQGDGVTFPKKGSKLTVHYVGRLEDGREFDSSRARQQPFTFVIGQGKMIKAWDEGLMRLSKGERALITAQPAAAYGAHGMPPTIPANAVLKFDVELLNVE